MELNETNQHSKGAGFGSLAVAFLTGAGVVAATYLAFRKIERRFSASAENVLERCSEAASQLEERLAASAA